MGFVWWGFVGLGRCGPWSVGTGRQRAELNSMARVLFGAEGEEEEG